MKSLAKFFIPGLAVMLLAAPVRAQTAEELQQLYMGDVTTSPFKPTDLCLDSSEAAFYDSLADAVARRSVDRLIALALPEYITLNRELASPAELRSHFSGPRADIAWEGIAKSISLGCTPFPTNADPELIVPQVYALASGAVRSLPMSAVTLGVEVWMFDGPDVDHAARLRILDWETVDLLDVWDPSKDVQRVRASDGVVGYILTEDLQWTLEWRVVGRKVGGRWYISAIARGF